MKQPTSGRAKKPARDKVLETAKHERQLRDYTDVRAGRRSAQSVHLFGRQIAREVVVRYKDVDFD